MKKLLILLLAVFLLAGCEQMTDPTTEATTEPTTQSTTQATTAPTTEPTTAPTTEATAAPTTEPAVEETEPTEPKLSPELWKPKSAYLSYKEYFSENQWFDRGCVRSWIVAGESSGYLFTLHVGEELVITCDALSERYTVPLSRATLMKYGNPKFLGTNGRIACFANETQIISIDLETGADTVLVTGEKLQNVYFQGGAVLYYIRYEYGDPVICRFYIPEPRENVLHYPEECWYSLFLSPPNSSHGVVKWQGYNPEMVALMEAELKNPNSIYKEDPRTYIAALWERENVFESFEPALLWAFEEIQKDTGVPAVCQGSFDCLTGQYEEKTGKLEDECCTGSVYPHDHFEETAELPVPKPVNSELQPYTVEERTQTWDALVYSWTEDGYYITDQNTIVKLSGDGSRPEVVYAAQYGQLQDIFLYQIKGLGEKEWLCARDGNRIVAIDTENRAYKVLFRNNHLISCWGWGDGRIFFELRHGMYYMGYVYDLETGNYETKRIL